MTQHHNAKFAFLYMLSLVALVFVAIAMGNIIFAIINQLIVDVNDYYPSINGLKFGISALIVATPIYYILMVQINKHLRLGNMNKESGIRRWLTYLILFVVSVVVIAWLVSVINGFLGGELTTMFALKFLTVFGISAVIFSYYFYDIKREQFGKDKVLTIFFYTTLVLIIATFTSALFFVEFPTEARGRKHDQEIISNFNIIDSDINNYYYNNEKLPENLDILTDSKFFMERNRLVDQTYKYEIVSDKKYKLCAEFATSNLEPSQSSDYRYMYDKSWKHDKGYQCIEQEVVSKQNPEPMPVMIR